MFAETGGAGAGALETVGETTAALAGLAGVLEGVLIAESFFRPRMMPSRRLRSSCSAWDKSVRRYL